MTSPGTTAEQLLLLGEVEEAGLEAFLDFVNDSYTIDGATVALADIIDDTGRRSASGLSINDTPDLFAIGDLEALLITSNFTIVLEFSAGDPSFAGHRLFFITAFDGDVAFLDQVATYTINRTLHVFDENAASDQRDLTDPINGFYANGTSRIAFTRTNTHLALSFDGNAVVTNEDPSGSLPNIDSVLLASANVATAGAFIRKLWIYDPLSDVELPALSA